MVNCFLRVDFLDSPNSSKRKGNSRILGILERNVEKLQDVKEMKAQSSVGDIWARISDIVDETNRFMQKHHVETDVRILSALYDISEEKVQERDTLDILTNQLSSLKAQGTLLNKFDEDLDVVIKLFDGLYKAHPPATLQRVLDDMKLHGGIEDEAAEEIVRMLESSNWEVGALGQFYSNLFELYTMSNKQCVAIAKLEQMQQTYVNKMYSKDKDASANILEQFDAEIMLKNTSARLKGDREFVRASVKKLAALRSA